MEIRTYKVTPLDKKSLAIVKRDYPKGAKVEAIRVNYVPRGMRGIIWDIRTNGDIVIKWNNGDSSVVEYRNESVRVLPDGQCLLGYIPGECEGGVCKECGWNDRVYRERIDRIRNNGMVDGKNGVKVLLVKKTQKVFV